MKRNVALSRLRAGKVAIGVFVSNASADLAEYVSSQGLDFVILDWQHGEWTDDRVSEALGRLIDRDTAPLVRIRSHDPGLIGPGDLMLDVKSKGLGESEHAILVGDVCAAAPRLGSVAGIVCPNAAAALERANQGFRFLVAGSDRGMVAESAKRTIQALKDHR